MDYDADATELLETYGRSFFLFITSVKPGSFVVGDFLMKYIIIGEFRSCHQLT